MSDREQVEQQLTQSLTEGSMDVADPQSAARDRVRTRYEIRIQTKMDPIIEETRQFRSMAEEVDDRYDEYMRRSDMPNSKDRC